MISILIFQKALPKYRDFLWSALQNKYVVNFYNSTPENWKINDERSLGWNLYSVGIFDGSVKQFAMLIRGFKYVRRRIAFTQLSRTSVIHKLIHEVYLILFFDHILFYYEHERNGIFFSKLVKKSSSFNNTVECSVPRFGQSEKIGDFLFLGRNTKKSELGFLVDCFIRSGVKDKLHVVGCDDFLNSKFENILFHGEEYLNERIERIAKSCNYFIYAGDVGLSIVHAIKLNLVPVIHSEMSSHMPEAKAVIELFPVLLFNRGDRESLVNLIKLCSHNHLYFDFSAAHSLFATEIVIDSFCRTIDNLSDEV
jgi:hypothetical protein